MTALNIKNTQIDASFVLELQATLLSHGSFNQAATAFATELALKLGLERVSVGITEHEQTFVKAVSNTADIKSKHDIYRIISAAMDEAIEQCSVIIHPLVHSDQPRVIVAHDTLTRTFNNQACTIPLVNNGLIFGAILLEHKNTSKFNKENVQAIEGMVSLLSPILQLKWNDDQSWYTHFKRDFSRWKHQNLSKVDTGLKLAIYSFVIAILSLLFIPMEYNISAPAHLEGSIQRALVASENGFLQQTYVHPGDKVKKNQILAELADQELILEKRRWQSELAQSENAFGSSLAQSDRVQMAINQAKIESARTELFLIEEKLARARIIAPFDGVIIKGDLNQSLGAPVQRGDVLLTISPIDSFRLIIEVDERDVSNVKPNQEGKVALVSLPDKTLSFRVKNIISVANTKEGRNFFEVEATPKNTHNVPLRPGLEGIAKIKVGKRPLIWKLTHRLTEWLKLQLWAMGM